MSRDFPGNHGVSPEYTSQHTGSIIAFFSVQVNVKHGNT